MRPPTFWPLATLTLGLAVFVLAAVASWQVAESAGPQSRAVLPLAQTYDDQAALAFQADPSKSRALTLRALALQPASARAWLRLAQLEAAAHGRLTPRALIWLGRSYEVGPYDAQILDERVRFAYDHWPELDADLREQVASQVKAAWPVAPQGDHLRAVAMTVANPSGRLALEVQLFSLKLADIVAAQASKVERPKF